MSVVFQLSGITVLDIVGDDASTILNNLTTNDIKSLGLGCGCETFVTDVKGKILGHVYAYRTPDGFRLLGAPYQAESIASHADRYTIREDATSFDRSDQFAVYVVAPNAPASVVHETDWGELQAYCYDVDWLGHSTTLLISDDDSAIKKRLDEVSIEVGDSSVFHHARTLANYPWYSVDLSEKNLPQEANRISETICFTKGCYLGQETVARLDALGQVQKQLVRWKTVGSIPQTGAEVTSNDKVVGRLTSIAQIGDDQSIAIGIARRSHFEPGAIAQGDDFQATVEENVPS